MKRRFRTMGHMFCKSGLDNKLDRLLERAYGFGAGVAQSIRGSYMIEPGLTIRFKPLTELPVSLIRCELDLGCPAFVI